MEERIELGEGGWQGIKAAADRREQRKDRVIRDPEDLEAAILEDELADAHEAALEGTIKMGVREYAKFKKMQPQLIYYYIRSGQLKEEPCVCGRKVLDVRGADEFFAARDAKKRSAT